VNTPVTAWVATKARATAAGPFRFLALIGLGRRTIRSRASSKRLRLSKFVWKARSALLHPGIAILFRIQMHVSKKKK